MSNYADMYVNVVIVKYNFQNIATKCVSDQYAREGEGEFLKIICILQRKMNKFKLIHAVSGKIKVTYL